MPHKQWMLTRFIAIQNNIITHRISRIEGHHCISLKPLTLDQLIKQYLSVFEHLTRLNTNNLIIQDGWELASQIPGLKEGCPIDIFSNIAHCKVLKYPAPDKFRFFRNIRRPINQLAIFTCCFQRDGGCCFLTSVLLANAHIVITQILNKFLSTLIREQAGGNRY